MVRDPGRDGGPRGEPVQVNLLETIKILHEHLTRSLCDRVFKRTRKKERQRRWTLQALIRFWTAVMIRAPRSLTQVLEEVGRGGDKLFPMVEATPEAFFKRCKRLRWAFFAGVYRAFLQRVLPDAPTSFASPVAFLRERFSEVWAIDGSRLDAVAHRLKILRKIRAVVLPGCVIVLYDLFRGITREILFSGDAAKAEMKRAFEIVTVVPKGALLLGDRLYCGVTFFAHLTSRGIYGVFRRNKRLLIRKIKRLRKVRLKDGILEDILVEVGCGATMPKQTLRWIRLRRPGITRDLLTNVLDPKRLSAEEALSLYPWRWSIERLFFDLKEVLNLHRFYAGSPNAVAMQVFAAAIVHTAFRIAQARIAARHGLKPEEISPAKFFPRLATASIGLTDAQAYFEATREANPGVRLNEPTWEDQPFAWTSLTAIQVEPRRGKRRKQRFCASRKSWKSFAHIPGGRKLS